MKASNVFVLAASLAAAACVEQPQPVSPNGVSQLVAPGQSPPPTSPDATLPPSMPAPLAASAAMQGNATYRTGSTFIVLGGSSIGGGIVFAILGVVLPCKLGDQNCSTPDQVQSQKSFADAFLDVGIGAIVLGGVLLAIGIPLAVVGANQARREAGYGFFADPHGLGLRF